MRISVRPLIQVDTFYMGRYDFLIGHCNAFEALTEKI